MRTDHIQKLNSACANLARLAETVVQEHRQQIAIMEKMMRSAEAAAIKTTSPLSLEAPGDGGKELTTLHGLRDAFDAVARGADGEK
jgi:hypothetical protein